MGTMSFVDISPKGATAMYRSLKQTLAARPETQLVPGQLADHAAIEAAGWIGAELSGEYTSQQEQMKQTPRKPPR
ncbi:hypothetical protein [Paenibacillus ginsengihumi]|uniref:hypothetical protein n=1 Tax=Paenibacillus ginsengihumi TaxID=431596 RepID=UPI00146CA45E|nr:hypothetical protein [Paenibacillus ginsengihumi]